MNPIATIRSILQAPADTLKAREALSLALTGRVIPDPKDDKEKEK